MTLCREPNRDRERTIGETNGKMDFFRDFMKSPPNLFNWGYLEKLFKIAT